MFYKEIIIIFKNNSESDDIFKSGSYSITYNNVSYEIKGDYLILEVNKEGEVEGHVLPLKSIINYKIIKYGSN
jgi:hypothetical protein